MTTAMLNGVEIAYTDGGAGPAVLLTHGYAASGDMWRPQRPALEPRYRLVTWDIRGHGTTESPADPGLYSHAHAVGDMRALLDHLGIERAVIGGLSLGGYLSLQFRLEYPEMVRALVLCCTGPGYRSEEPRAGWNRMAERAAERLEEGGLDALRGGPEVQQAEHRSAEGLALAARGILAQNDAAVIDSLPKVDVPTLVIAGSDDERYLGPSEYMAKKIPGARYAVIEGAGHAANMDRPDAFDEVLLDFLDGLER